MHRYRIRRAPASDATSPDWTQAEVLSAFTFPWEDTPAPLTEFRALWDDHSLHFRFDCHDADLVLPDGPTVKDRVLGSDRVEIFFAPDLTLASYHCLEMSPRGDALAYAAKFYREIDWTWQCPGLQLTAQITGPRYHVTGSIPLSTLRDLHLLRGNEIHAGLYRAEFSHRPDGTVHSGWMPWVDPHTPTPDFHLPASFGILELVP